MEVAHGFVGVDVAVAEVRYNVVPHSADVVLIVAAATDIHTVPVVVVDVGNWHLGSGACMPVVRFGTVGPIPHGVYH